MHDHESKVICKCICNEVPISAKVLEPNLRRFVNISTV